MPPLLSYEKNRLTQAIRTAGIKIFNHINQSKKHSIRDLAKEIDLSKSSVHRQIKGIEKRNQHPESLVWETESGQEWLSLLVFGTLFSFGIGAGVGAESISLFFKLIQIDTHVGISPSVLRRKLQMMEELLPKFQTMCEKNQSSSPKDAVVALDETFFGKFMILVMMDLKSGYLLLEDVADDRCYDTWFKKTLPRLNQLGITVTHAISDRAKASALLGQIQCLI